MPGVRTTLNNLRSNLPRWYMTTPGLFQMRAHTMHICPLSMRRSVVDYELQLIPMPNQAVCLDRLKKLQRLLEWQPPITDSIHPRPSDGYLYHPGNVLKRLHIKATGYSKDRTSWWREKCHIFRHVFLTKVLCSELLPLLAHDRLFCGVSTLLESIFNLPNSGNFLVAYLALVTVVSDGQINV